MAKIIDLGLKKADDPIFPEGIRFTSIRKPTSPLEAVITNDLVTTPAPTKETPNEHQK